MRLTLIVGLVVSIVLSAAFAFSAEEAKVDYAKLIDQLGDDDFAKRKQAAKTLLEHGDKAVPALKAALKDHKDAHVRFEATKLLRKIEAAKTKAEAPLEEKSTHRARMNRQLEDMLRRLEQQGLLGEEELERFRKMLEAGEQAHTGLSSSGTMQGTIVTGDRQIQYRRASDGSVTVRITEDGETKTWEAKSLEELKKKAPEVHAEIVKHFGNVRIFKRAEPFIFDFPWPQTPGRRPKPREVPLGGVEKKDPPGGFRLGIWVGEVSEALRTHLKLEMDEGVLIEEVVKGSLGDRMGLQRLDVVRKLNGVRIANAPAIRKELEKVADGGKVTLQVIRKGDPLTLVGTR